MNMFNSLDSQIQIFLLDGVNGTASFAVNWLLQSTLLISIGLIVGALLRSRGSAVQSLVYRTTLVAVLVCPLATVALSSAGFSGWSVTMPETWAMDEIETAIEPDLVSEPSPEFVQSDPLPESNTNLESMSPDNGNFTAPAFVTEPILSSPIANLGGVPKEIVEPPVEASDVPEAAFVPPVTESIFTIRKFGVFASIAALVWLLVAFMLVLRLASAWWRLWRLKRSATEVEPELHLACEQLSVRMEVTAPEVYRSPFLPSPCLAGLRNPSILLPENDCQLSIQDVLIHELAHLRRHDCHWNLLRQIATSVFFFQPLLWILSRKLEIAAEEVCDDFVVQFGGDRTEYANRLVGIAELSTAPIAAAGVGVVSLRSMLGQRVTRILDTSRTLSTQASKLLFVTVLGCGLAGTAMTGLLGLGNAPTLDATSSSDVTTVDGPFESAFKVEPGESKDLGNVKLGDEGKIQAMIEKTISQFIEYRGKVVDEGDRPVANATVEMNRWRKGPALTQHAPLATSTSGPEGEFELIVDKSKFPDAGPRFWKETALVAQGQGYGIDWVDSEDIKPNQPIELRLVSDDVPVKGRLVSLEGEPLSDVSVRVEMLWASDNQDLNPVLKAWNEGQIFWEATNKHLPNTIRQFPQVFQKGIKTDAEGYFSISGFGQERAIVVVIEGPTVAYTRAVIVTRKMEPIVANDGIPNPDWNRQQTIHGANCVVTVPPSQPITGIVKDAKTGEPMAGVAIESYRMTERGISAQREIRVKTDKDGRYTLRGLPKGAGNQIIAVPNDDQPYLMRVFEVPNPTGMKPIDLDLELNRGVWITGQLTNKATGKNIRVEDEAYVYYYPYLANPFAQATPEYDRQNFDGYQQRYKIAADGSYRLVGLPGKAIVGATVGYAPYPQGQGAEDIEGADERGWFPTYRVGVGPGPKHPTIFAEVDIAEAAESFELNFQLDSGKKIAIAMTDPAGEALEGVKVQGHERFSWWKEIPDATFDALAFKIGEKRTMLFHHPDRRLGKVVRVTAGEDADQKLSVQLQPCVTVRGRLVDRDEEPISGARIRIDVSPSEDFAPNLKNVSTDADGRFEHTEVLPGSEYAVMAEAASMGFTVLARNLTVSAGETMDLGTINVSNKERPEPKRIKSAKATDSSRKQSTQGNTSIAAVLDDNDSEATETRLIEAQSVEDFAVKSNDAPAAIIRTVILLPDGSPATETHVALTGFDYETSKEVVFDSGITNENGEFSLTCKGLGSELDSRLLIARKDGMAVGWKMLNQSKMESDEPIKISLHNQGVVKGRLVDIDGQPAVGEKLQVEMVINPKADRGSVDAMAGFQMSRDGTAVEPPKAWIQPVTTDEEGRFELTGVPESFGLYIRLFDSKKFAPQGISLNTGQPEQRGPRDGTYRSLVKNVEPGVEAVLTLSPAKVITGKVTYEDTGEPVPNSKISIWASQQEFGSMTSVFGKTDADGNYRVLPEPGIRFGVSAYPPTGVAYMGRKSEQLDWENSDVTRNADIQLPRVTLVEGLVIEKGTGKPVADATITFESSGRNAPKNAITGWQAQQKTNGDGKFTYAVPAGHGTLVVRKKDSNYVLQTMDSRKMISDKPGGSRFYANAFHKMEVKKGTDKIEAKIEVLPGKSVRGVIVDENGNSIEEAYIVTRLKSWDLAGGWRGDSRPTVGGKFELTGLELGESYKVHFLDARQKLGTTIELKATDEEVKVVLKPCGSVTAKFIVEDEQNRETMRSIQRPSLYFILMPGVAQYDFEARKLGKLAADEDFVENIDRVNYGMGGAGPKLDDEFRVTYPALIPGATYRLQTTFDQSWGYKEFTAKSGETVDLGEFTPKFSD